MSVDIEKKMRAFIELRKAEVNDSFVEIEENITEDELMTRWKWLGKKRFRFGDFLKYDLHFQRPKRRLKRKYRTLAYLYKKLHKILRRIEIEQRANTLYGLYENRLN